jgi:hypothetical protein
LPTGTTGPGISYQWASSASAAGPFSTMLGTNSTQATGALAATTYYVVTVTCATSGSTSSAAVFTQTVNPVPTAAAASNGPVCAGAALNLSVTTDIGTTFAWAGPNTFIAAIQNPSVSSALTASNGTYTVTVTLGACSATSTVVAVVNPQPVVSAITATPPSVCSGANSQLLANVPVAVSGYVVTASSGTFTPVTGGTVLTLTATDTGNSPTTNIGFSFVYGGVTYSTFRAMSDGFISLNAGTPTSLAGNDLSSANTTQRPIIAPFWVPLLTGY